MEYPLLQYYVNTGPNPNKPNDVTVTHFNNPQKFWIRRIKSTDTLIKVLEHVRKCCSSNSLKRPSKEAHARKRKECTNEIPCVFHEQSKNHEGNDYAIVWNVPDNPKDHLCIAADKLLKKYGLKKGDLVYARSHYIQNKDNYLYECSNRVIIKTAYLPNEDFLPMHLLVQFIDEGENHTEWISISDISLISIADKQQLLEDSTLEADEIILDSEDQDEYLQFTELSTRQFLNSFPSDDDDIKISTSDISLDLSNTTVITNETLTIEEFEYVDDDVYCGKLTDFGLQPGGVVLAQCNKIKDTSPFHRGKIIKMQFEETLGLHLQIFFFDYGHTEWIHILDTRLMPKDLKEIAPLAEEVSLYNLYPTWIFEPNEEPSDHGWSQKACKHFMRMISTGDLPNLSDESSHSYVELPNGKQEYYVPRALCLHTYETVAKKNYVDIYYYPKEKDGLASKGDPVSVRDILLFMGMGCMADPRRFYQASVTTNEPINNMPPFKSLRDIYEEGSFSAIRISHVESPDEIYVQPLNYITGGTKSTEVLLQRIGKELELFYDKIYSSNPYVIEEPIVGSLCAVKRYGLPGKCGLNTNAYGKRWYRCIIENVPPKTRLIEVFLVDVGVRYMTTPGKYLYLLNLDRFVYRYEHALCFPVRLDNIVKPGPFIKEPKHITEKLYDGFNSYDSECIPALKHSFCSKAVELEDTVEVLNNFADSVFVMHVVNKATSLSNPEYLQDWELDSYPSVNLFREISPWDDLEESSREKTEKKETPIICINSLLNSRRLQGIKICSNNMERKKLVKRCDNLDPKSSKTCSHPTIQGSMMRWMASKLETKDITESI